MKLKVFKKEEVEKVVRVTIENVGIDVILLAVCDENGKTIPHGDLLTISPRGVRLSKDIDLDLGFALDVCGELKIYR